MNVNDLIELLERVETKGAIVYMHNASSALNEVEKVIVEHDMDDDEVVVVLKTHCDK